MRPTWVEVDLAALCRNYRAIQQHVGEAVTVCSVVKAEAYGHGAVECARALEAEGATWFGVTSTDEGLSLRTAGVGGRILLMTGFWHGDEDNVVRHELTPTVFEPWHVEAIEEVCERLNKQASVHLKLDTGMSRLGVTPQELPAMLAAIKQCSHIQLEGVFSHLASSEVLDDPNTQRQIAHFEQLRAQVCRAGFEPAYTHLANTTAMVARRNTWFNMVRPGLALYGYSLPAICGGSPAGIEAPPVAPVLSWKSRVIAVKDVAANAPVGYGGAYVTKSPARLAYLPVGYADGLNRKLSSRGRVIVRGQYAPIVGNISMDLTIVDVTAVPGVSVGDEVVLLGTSGDLSISVWEQAEICGTIPYEVLCNIGHRVPRVHLK